LIDWDQDKKSQFKVSVIIAWSILVIVPLLFVVVSYMVKTPLRAGGEYKMLFYILFIVGVFQPFVLKIVESFQINNYHKNLNTSITPAKLYSIIYMIKCSFIEAIYIYGLLVYLLSGNRMEMLYFYPVGIVWSFVYWPNKSKFNKFIEKVENNGQFSK